MSDNRTLKLLQASYKGIPFNIRSEAQDASGNRIILHEYPHSTERFVEYNGAIPKSFTLDAFVHGVDWLDRSRQLEQVLNERSPGRLVMPIFGSIRVHAGPYSKVASQQSVGEIRFSIPFHVGRDTSGPTRDVSSIQDVQLQGDAAREGLNENFARYWAIGQEIAALLTGEFDLESITRRSIAALSTYVGPGPLSNVLKVASRTQLNPGSIIRSAGLVGGDLFGSEGIFQNFSEGLGDGTGVFAAITMASFGTGVALADGPISGSSPSNGDFNTQTGDDYTVALWPDDTQSRIDRNQNRQLIVQSSRVAALTLAFEEASAREYDTAEEIEDVRNQIEDAYNQVMVVGAIDSTFPQTDNTVRTAINNARNAMLEILRRKEQDAFRVGNFEVLGSAPAAVLAYQLYGDDLTTSSDLEARALVIRNLNRDQPSVALSGNTRVLLT